MDGAKKKVLEPEPFIKDTAAPPTSAWYWKALSSQLPKSDYHLSLQGYVSSSAHFHPSHPNIYSTKKKVLSPFIIPKFKIITQKTEELFKKSPHSVIGRTEPWLSTIQQSQGAFPSYLLTLTHHRRTYMKFTS